MSLVAVPGLLREVRQCGRFDVNGCLNCGSCTVVCDLSEGHASFPRRLIQLTLLGLKAPVRGSLEPWLCHDCGDCSTTCPRQAEPRESMMTLRRYLTTQYDFTGLSSKLLRSRTAETLTLSLVGALVFILVVLYHFYYKEVPMSVSEFVSTPMGLEHMFPTIVYFTIAVCLIPVLILLVNAFRMYRFTMGGDDKLRTPFRFYAVEAKTMFWHMVSQRNMRKCADATPKNRWVKHWLLGFAFSLKFLIILFLLKWFQTDGVYPVYDPQRWVGYLIALVLILLPAEILVGRFRKRQHMYKFSEFSDLTLPVMLLLTAVSGIAVHVFRYLEFSMACHYAYAIHLAIAVPLIVVELPFGKLSHLVYRPLAIYFQAVKERALAEGKLLVGEKTPDETILKEAQPA